MTSLSDTDPRAQALFETADEALGGLKKAFEDYEAGNDQAWQGGARPVRAGSVVRVAPVRRLLLRGSVPNGHLPAVIRSGNISRRTGVTFPRHHPAL